MVLLDMYCTISNIEIDIFFSPFFVPNNINLVLSFPKWMLSLLSTNQSHTLKKECWCLHQLLWHLCVGTINKSHLRKGTIHSLQPRTCHCHKIETKELYNRSVWYSTVDVSNIGILNFDIDLKSSIREVRFKLCNELKRKYFFNKILWFMVSNA